VWYLLFVARHMVLLILHSFLFIYDSLLTDRSVIVHWYYKLVIAAAHKRVMIWANSHNSLQLYIYLMGWAGKFFDNWSNNVWQTRDDWQIFCSHYLFWFITWAIDKKCMCHLFCDRDGRERAIHCNKRKQLKAIRRNADANQHSDLNQPLIPVSE